MSELSPVSGGGGGGGGGEAAVAAVVVAVDAAANWGEISCNDVSVLVLTLS